MGIMAGAVRLAARSLGIAWAPSKQWRGTWRCHAHTQAGSPLTRFMLKPNRVGLFQKHRTPLVYDGAIAGAKGRVPAQGDAVLVCDPSGRPFAWGMYNPESLYRIRQGLEPGGGGLKGCAGAHAVPGGGVRSATQTPRRLTRRPPRGRACRVMDHEETLEAVQRDPTTAIRRLLEARLGEAVGLRRALGLPGPETDVFRLVNGCGRGLVLVLGRGAQGLFPRRESASGAGPIKPGCLVGRGGVCRARTPAPATWPPAWHAAMGHPMHQNP